MLKRLGFLLFQSGMWLCITLLPPPISQAPPEKECWGFFTPSEIKVVQESSKTTRIEGGCEIQPGYAGSDSRKLVTYLKTSPCRAFPRRCSEEGKRG